MANWFVLADIPRRQIVRSLERKGFTQTKRKGNHDWFVFCHDGREYKQVMAKVSRGSGYKTYSPSLWTQMKKLLALDRNSQVHDLLTCPLDRDEYLEILKHKRIVR